MNEQLENKGRFSREWDGVPVTDAEHELRVFANTQDIATAVRGDEKHCVFANACRRIYGAKRVAFCRTVAYVELEDEQGKPRIERFCITESMREALAEFDRTGKAHPGGFLLSPPSKGNRLDHMLEAKRRREKRKREAAVRGEILEPSKNAGTPHGKFGHPFHVNKKPHFYEADGVRNSTGMVQFNAKRPGVIDREEAKAARRQAEEVA